MALRFLAVLALVSCTQSTPSPSHVEIVTAPAEGSVATYIASELARAAPAGVPVLVYVGATWCEPCRDFHRAALAGSLDASLAPIRFLEFDLDRDGERLAAAGYRSQFVPLFARPNLDGTASTAQTDGVRKGGDYVEQLTPRIRALVQR